MTRETRVYINGDHHNVRRGANEVIGNITRGGCENITCQNAITEGREWHAIPMGFAITLPTYHYATADEAIDAIVTAMENIPGRRIDLDVGDDIAWKTGEYDTSDENAVQA